MQFVLEDLLTYDGDDSPVARRGTAPESVLFRRRTTTWTARIENVLLRHDAEAWRILSEQQERWTRSAGEDLVRRQRSGHQVEFSMDDERIHLTDQEGSGQRVSRPIQAWPPGYANECTVAVVYLSIPWSMHHANATYVLQYSPAGWSVLLRQFVYYV